MELALLISLALSVAMLLIVIRVYEKRVESLEADLDWALDVMTAQPDARVADLGVRP